MNPEREKFHPPAVVAWLLLWTLGLPLVSRWQNIWIWNIIYCSPSIGEIELFRQKIVYVWRRRSRSTIATFCEMMCGRQKNWRLGWVEKQFFFLIFHIFSFPFSSRKKKRERVGSGKDPFFMRKCGKQKGWVANWDVGNDRISFRPKLPPLRLTVSHIYFE